jgi:hypothetical protein
VLAPEQLRAPEGPFEWEKFLRPHRFMLLAVWDEAARCVALALLLVFVLFLVRAVEGRRAADCAAASVALALALLATPFALFPAVLLALCLLAVLRPEAKRANVALAGAVGALGWALAARWLPPSLWGSLIAASAANEPWSFRSVTALCGTALVWLVALHGLRRWKADWRIAFALLFTVAAGSGPVLARWMDRQFLPHPTRFRIELEAAIVLLALFAVRPLAGRLPRTAQAALGMAIMAFTVQQVLVHRRLAKDALYPADPRETIEYRTAARVARELPGQRVMLPGSIALWANAFADGIQLGGSDGSLAYSRVQQRAMKIVYEGQRGVGDDPRVSLAWLQAFGATAVVVPGPSSREFWKPFVHTDKFDGVLPVLWKEEGVTAYRVPQRTASLAHVVPEGMLVRRPETASLWRYSAALDSEAFPPATLEWQGRNRMRVAATAGPGQVISIQVNYHPGWRAAQAGRSVEVRRDGLGFLWLRPAAEGAAEIDLEYTGGWGSRVCGWLTAGAMLVAGACLLTGLRRSK